MEIKSATAEEELSAEKTSIFYLHRPCYFLEEAVRALLRCLGLEIGSKQPQQEEYEQNCSNEENNTRCRRDNPTNNQTIICSKQDQDVDPPSTAREQQVNERRRPGPRRSGLDRGQDPQVN